MTDADATDLMAAEYVLGTLDAEERAAVERRRSVDAALNAAIDAWSERFEPLLDAVSEVDPPPHVYEALTERLFKAPAVRVVAERGGANPDQSVDQSLALRRSLRLWRGATAACAALAAALALWIAVAGIGSSDSQFVAVLQKDPASPAFLVDVDLKRRSMTIRPVSASVPAGKSLELWIIAADLGAPRSLGIIDPEHERRRSLDSFDPGTVTKALYAVTVEPKGGAPGGVPTSAPVWAGRLTLLAP
jgi:anti-sigma-K factor RskA